jgi:pilus assembly protein Flp/PilA
MGYLMLLKAMLASVRRDEKGATAIEYGLLAALIAVVLIVALQTLGQNLQGRFNDVATAVQ